MLLRMRTLNTFTLGSISTVVVTLSGTGCLHKEDLAAAPTELSSVVKNFSLSATRYTGIESELVTGQAMREGTLVDSPFAEGEATYSVSPALPAGISLDAATGKVSGTPLAVSAPKVYAITGKSRDGRKISATVKFSVRFAGVGEATVVSDTRINLTWPALPDHTYRIYRVDGSVSTLLATVPAGTGAYALTGLTAGTVYNLKVTAVNAAGFEDGNTVRVSATTTANQVAPSGLSYSAPTATYIAGSPIPGNTVTALSNGTGVVYSVTPALPSGLAINPTTGAITGTPTAVMPAAAPFVVKATNANGFAQATLQLAVDFAGATGTSLSGLDGTSVRVQWNALANHSYKVYRVVNGALAASPTAAAAGATSAVVTGLATLQPATFRVRAVNGSGQEDGNTVNVSATPGSNVVAPTQLTYPQSSLTLTAGAAMSPLTVSAVNGTSPTFAISPSLPAGLAINASNGRISGTPTVVSPSKSYTVTASNAGGSVSAALTIAINYAGISQATANADGTATLAWPALASHTFKTYRAQGATGAFSALGTAAAGSTGVSVTGLAPQTVYRFRVHAVNASAEEDANAAEASITTPALNQIQHCVADGVYRAKSEPVLQQNCVGCHAAGGLYSAYLSINAGAALTGTPLQQNYAALLAKIDRSGGDSNASTLLSRLRTSGPSHPVKFAVDSSEYMDLKAWVDDERQFCAPSPTPSPSATPSPSGTPTSTPTPSPTPSPTGSGPAPADLFNGVDLRTPRETLRKAAWQLVGRLPTDAELAQVSNSDLNSLDPILTSMMGEAAFLTRVKEIFNDVLLTNGGITGGAVHNGIVDNFVAPPSGNYTEYKIRGIPLATEPVEYVAHVVELNRPITEIVTGRYRLLNSVSAKTFGIAGLSGSNFVEVADPALKQDEYAGILTTHAFQWRYPNTETNRNRKKARYVLKIFLGFDIMKLSQPALDTTNLTGNAPWKTNSQCIACHVIMDPVAGLMHNWSKAGYQYENLYRYEANWWYTYRNNGNVAGTENDMFVPGYYGSNLPNTDAAKRSSMQFLGDKIAADSRFLPTMARHVFQGLTGYEAYPEPAYVDQLIYKNAAIAQDAFFNATADKMRANGSNLKVAFIEVIKSPWFRAKNADQAGRQELVGAGGGQALTPEALSRKLLATLGAKWTVQSSYDVLGNIALDMLAGPPRTFEYHELSYGSPDFYLLMGGIDSNGIVKRGRLHNGVSASVIEKAAIEMACSRVDADFALAKASRTLFPLVDKTDLPGGANDALIKTNLVHLHTRLFGDELTVDHPDILRAYQLLVDARTTLAASGASSALASACKSGGSNTADANYMMRSWQAVLAYMVMDPKFILE